MAAAHVVLRVARARVAVSPPVAHRAVNALIPLAVHWAAQAGAGDGGLRLCVAVAVRAAGGGGAGEGEGWVREVQRRAEGEFRTTLVFRGAPMERTKGRAVGDAPRIAVAGAAVITPVALARLEAVAARPRLAGWDAAAPLALVRVRYVALLRAADDMTLYNVRGGESNICEQYSHAM